MGLEGEKENNTVEVYERRVVKEVYGHSDTDLPGERIFLGEGDLLEIWNETRSADKEMQELIAKTTANEGWGLELAVANNLVKTGWETQTSSVEEGSHLGQEEEKELFISSFNHEPSSQTGGGEEMKYEAAFTGRTRTTLCM